MNQDDRFLTIREAARVLNFSRKHVYELVQCGKLRASKVWGNRWRVPIDAVQQLKQAREAAVSQ